MPRPFKTHVQPQLIQWAIERSQRDPAALAERFPKLNEWRSGKDRPTLKQLESFAAATRTPVGYLFLASPPAEPVPIPDFRTVRGRPVRRPSPDLLDTIYLCQQRQDWYRQHAQLNGEAPVPFIGSASADDSVEAVARRIRDTVGFDLAARTRAESFEDALRMMIRTIDDAGVLVMVSGIVASNTHRPLDVEEFRGFALSDNFAPLVFINGKDTKAGQMFTLAHELAHIWLGQSALTDSTAGAIARNTPPADGSDIERWCNAVAAEMLVPIESFRTVYRTAAAVRRCSPSFPPQLLPSGTGVLR